MGMLPSCVIVIVVAVGMGHVDLKRSHKMCTWICVHLFDVNSMQSSTTMSWPWRWRANGSVIFALGEADDGVGGW